MVVKLSTKVGKGDIGDAVRFLEEGGSVAKAFRESLEAGGTIVDDVKKVAAAMHGLLNCGLTREALVVLLQAKIGNQRNGKLMPKQTVNDVVEALGNLDHFLVKAGGK